MASLVEQWMTVKVNSSELVDILVADEFPEQRARVWMAAHWPFFVQMTILYFFTIFGLKAWMKNREPFDLQRPLNAWNLFLAVFSTGGAIFMAPEFFGIFYNRGFQGTYCEVGGLMSGTNGYWMFLFMLSKLAEFTDTIFIVLRKKPLMFLHWYHHMLTLIYGVYSYPTTPAFNRWGVYLNFCIHSVMYSYYFLRSINIKIPGPIAKVITTGQIMQFVISIYVLVVLGYRTYFENLKCDFHLGSYWLACLMDATYLALFVNFFLHAYIFKGGKAKYQTKAAKKID